MPPQNQTYHVLPNIYCYENSQEEDCSIDTINTINRKQYKIFIYTLII